MISRQRKMYLAIKYYFAMVFTGFAWLSFGQQVNLTGVYQGKPIYLQNPYLASSQTFCVQSITINGQAIASNLSLSAISISFQGLELYTPVSIKIVCHADCKPKILNPDAILYHSHFKFDSLVLNDSTMQWYTKGDSPQGRYKIEKLKADRWDVLKVLPSKGLFNGAAYVYYPQHNEGGNRYRIKYELNNGRYLYSMEMEHDHYPQEIFFFPRAVTDRMTFSQKADYEILQQGRTILGGRAKSIPLHRLPPGDYIIVLNGKKDTFVKK